MAWEASSVASILTVSYELASVWIPVHNRRSQRGGSTAKKPAQPPRRSSRRHGRRRLRPGQQPPRLLPPLAVAGSLRRAKPARSRQRRDPFSPPRGGRHGDLAAEDARRGRVCGLAYGGAAGGVGVCGGWICGGGGRRCGGSMFQIGPRQICLLPCCWWQWRLHCDWLRVCPFGPHLAGWARLRWLWRAVCDCVDGGRRCGSARVWWLVRGGHCIRGGGEGFGGRHRGGVGFRLPCRRSVSSSPSPPPPPPPAWPVYWVAQGTMFWPHFVLGHNWCVSGLCAHHLSLRGWFAAATAL